MTEKKGPLDQALDLFVYAPLGLALAAHDELPKLVERGRTQVQAQATLARMVGRFAITQGQKEAEKLVRRVAGDGTGTGTARPSPPGVAGRVRSPGPASHRQAPPAQPSATSGNGTGPSAEHLAIPGYDALAASQVVPRLAGLSSEELEAVRRYESGTRNRRTILARIQQIQSPAG